MRTTRASSPRRSIRASYIKKYEGEVKESVRVIIEMLPAEVVVEEGGARRRSIISLFQLKLKLFLPV